MTEADVVELFQRYAHAFTSLDADAVAALYDSPCSIVTVAGTAVFARTEDTRANMVALCNHYRSSGLTRAEVGAVVVEHASATLAGADVRWQLHVAGRVAEFGTRYWIARRRGDLRIAAALAYEERLD